MDAAKKREREVTTEKIRKYGLEVVHTADSGHISGSFSIAEILVVLYFDCMNIDLPLIISSAT